MGKFIMLIGLPGSGKSSWVKEYLSEHEDVIVVSSDAIREEVFGDVNDQSHNGEVFNLVHQRIVAAIKDNIDVILDATNLSRKKRIGFLKSIPKVESEAVVFAIPFEVCCERNNKRDRVVPQNVMNRMYRSFQPPHYAEGFDSIQIVGCSDFENIDSYIFECERKNIMMPHDNPHHRLSCGKHCLAAGRYIRENYPNDIDLQLAARFHDVSKYKCKVFHNAKGEPSNEAHYYNHENVSAYDFMVHFYAMSVDRSIKIANLIANHMVFYAGEQAVQKRKRLYGEEFWQDLEKIHKADQMAH